MFFNNTATTEIYTNLNTLTIHDAKVGDSTKQRMKSMYNLMYKYCLKYDIVEKDYAALCESVKRGKPKIVRIPFSSEEIQTLWDNVSFPFVDMVLIGIYSGWRPQELAILKVADIDLEARTMFGGLKTDAGRNRVVPIHSAIYDLVVANNQKLCAKHKSRRKRRCRYGYKLRQGLLGCLSADKCSYKFNEIYALRCGYSSRLYGGCGNQD